MIVSWRTFSKDDADIREIFISEKSDPNLFQSVAEVLALHIPGQWTAQINGLDQRYWDYESNGGKITLHLEHYLGISIFPTAGANADSNSAKLLEEAYRVLSSSHT